MAGGEPRGIWEKILTLFRTRWQPVAVMIDEADAYLGDRQVASGDSGGFKPGLRPDCTVHEQHGESWPRIVWFLMTRPDQT